MHRPVRGETDIGRDASAARNRFPAAGPLRGALTPFAGLAALTPFTDDEKSYLASLLGRVEHHRPGVQIIAEGASLDCPRFIVSGWGCLCRTLSDGRRQILAFYLPGDLLGYSARSGSVALGTYMALTRMETAPAAEIVRDASRSPRAPHLSAALEALQVQEEDYLLAQIVRIGRQTAYERFASLMLEFYGRLERAGLASECRFHMPLTQEALGDGLGLSIVHINRTVQQLKREGLIAVNGAVVTLLRPDALGQIADYRERDIGAAAAHADGNGHAAAS